MNKNKKVRMDIPVRHIVDCRQWVLPEIKRTFQNNKRVNSLGSRKNSTRICASQQCVCMKQKLTDLKEEIGNS